VVGIFAEKWYECWKVASNSCAIRVMGTRRSEKGNGSAATGLVGVDGLKTARGGGTGFVVAGVLEGVIQKIPERSKEAFDVVGREARGLSGSSESPPAATATSSGVLNNDRIFILVASISASSQAMLPQAISFRPLEIPRIASNRSSGSDAQPGG
jgi:hypothetical protein